MTTYAEAHAALNRLEEAGAEPPKLELIYHRLTDTQVTEVLEALDTYEWRVSGHAGSVWIEAVRGGVKVTVHMADDRPQVDGPVVTRARALLAKVRA